MDFISGDDPLQNNYSSKGRVAGVGRGGKASSTSTDLLRR